MLVSGMFDILDVSSPDMAPSANCARLANGTRLRMAVRFTCVLTGSS
jgi:hypothetical protein